MCPARRGAERGLGKGKNGMKALWLKKLNAVFLIAGLAISLTAAEDVSALLKKGVAAWNAKPRQDAAAFEAFDQAAKLGSPEGLMWSALCYRQGVGVAADADKAFSLMRRAAATSSDAQFLLGMMYLRGDGVGADAYEAITCFRRSATAGNANAQYQLGLAYRDGIGTPRSDEDAVRWLNRSLDQGNMYAAAALSRNYLKGIGVPKNGEKALALAEKSADAGNALGKCALADCYLAGFGCRDSAATEKAAALYR